MTHLTPEAKEAIIVKALSRGNVPLDQIAADCGVGCSTLQTWLRLKRQGLPLKSRRDGRAPEGQGQTPPLQHLLVTASLDDEALGAYCREQGIHSFQLTQWKNDLMKNDSNKKIKDNSRDEIKLLREENKKLKKDLRRKDKALAETSALLVLKKKANLIWGELEDD